MTKVVKMDNENKGAQIRGKYMDEIAKACIGLPIKYLTLIAFDKSIDKLIRIGALRALNALDSGHTGWRKNYDLKMTEALRPEYIQNAWLT